MKKSLFLIFLTSLFPLALLSSCIESPGCIGWYEPLDFYMSNQCGHTISIVHRPSCTDLPDSLVLHDGEEYMYSEGQNKMDAKIFFWPLTLEGASRIIYYDGRYALNFHEVPVDRRFYYETNYESKTRDSGIFIFTPDDYDYAVANGRDLGEKP